MENTDFELLKNTTILFFLDHLMEKGQPRSLHDLSCQFGAKGFNRDMKQIVGGSQSGLKRFFSQFPSIFTVEGDNVSITTFNNNTLNFCDNKLSYQKIPTQKDYIQEAIEFFKMKLLQYGNTPVPIRSLLGHRSQASTEIRHISGRHVKEFAEFLKNFPDIFIVHDDLVSLHESIIIDDNASTDSNNSQPKNRSEGDLTKDLIIFFKSVLERRGSLFVEQLFGHMSSKFTADERAIIAKNPRELSLFLQNYPQAFKLQSDLVSLAPDSSKSFPSISNNPTISSTSINSVNPVVTTAPGKFPSLKERVASTLLKVVADNKAKDCRDNESFQSLDSEINESDSQILKNIHVVTKVKMGKLITREIFNSPRAVIAVDCEGCNLGVDGPLSLLILSTWEGQVYIFDLQVNKDMMNDAGLKQVLESTSIVKVMHDCRADSAALYHQFGVTLQNVFDTQVSHSVIQYQQTGKPLYEVKDISLSTLCKRYGAHTGPRREKQKKTLRRTDYWIQRPLTDEMLLYLSCDTLAIFPRVYEVMKGLMLAKYIPLFKELSKENVDLFIFPEKVQAAKRERKLDMELDVLKKKLCEGENNLVLSNRERRLLRFLDLTQEERQRLEAIAQIPEISSICGDSCHSGDFDSQDEEEFSKCNVNGLTDIITHSPVHLPNYINLDLPFFPSDTSIDEKLNLTIPSFSEEWDSMVEEASFVKTKIENCNEKELTTETEKQEGSGEISEQVSCTCDCHQKDKMKWSDIACQTISTGGIVITTVFFEEN